MLRSYGVVFIASILVAGGQSVSADGPGFQGLGVGTVVADLSGDGRVAVGSAGSSSPTTAFRWEAGTLSYLAPYGSSAARLVSQDGSVIAGKVVSGLPGQVVTQQVRWVNGVMSVMGGLSGYSSVEWSASSADGSVVVGIGLTGNISNVMDGLRWTNDSAQVLEGSPTERWYVADTTADGGSIVGVNPNGGFRWDNGTVSPVCIDPGDANTVVYGISSDGSIMVGRRQSVSPSIPPWTSSGMASSSEGSASDTSFYRWVNGVPEAIGEPPEPNYSQYYMTRVKLSGNGSTICTSQTLLPIELEASQAETLEPIITIWRTETGWRDIEDILINDCHLDLTGWTIGAIMGISDDGLTIVGLGVNPTGATESWIAHIPEPTSLALSLVAFGGVGGGRLRRRRR